MGLSLRSPCPPDGRGLRGVPPQDLSALLRRCLEGTLAQYPPGYIATLIEANHVPEGFRDEVCDYLLVHPELAGVTKEGFLEAIATVRPDWEPALRSPQGDAWIEHVLKEIPGGLPGRFLNGLAQVFRR